MNSIKQISFAEYLENYDTATVINPKLKQNVSAPVYNKENIYLQSEEGCSVLNKDGMLCGIFRFKKGSEKIAKLHQQTRIQLGGTFLECFHTHLVTIYKKQGFKIVASIPFNEEFAPEGWEQDNDLKHKPDVVFMSLENKPFKEFINYEDAYNYTKPNNKDRFKLRVYRKTIDAMTLFNYDLVQMLSILKTDLNKADLSTVNNVGHFIVFNDLIEHNRAYIETKLV